MRLYGLKTCDTCRAARKALAAAGLIRVDGLQRGHEGMVAVRFLGVTDG